jgi:UDP-3-O-[3-hydroxymyristoyl] glucosamine N-acyltransferase
MASITNLHHWQNSGCAKKGAITFLANPKYEKFIYTTEASAVIVKRGF